MPKRVILGPQLPHLNLGEAFARAALPDSPVAVISAGLREAEGDLDHVYKVVQRPLVDLQLYRRTELIFEQQPTLREAYRQRQDRLKQLQRLYRQRLRQLTLAARQIMTATADAELLEPELRHAIAQLRALDQHHINRVEGIHRKFFEALDASSQDQLTDHRQQILAALADCETVLLTGGHIAILLNRLALFDLREPLVERHLVAWSAGAMALSDVVVLFHDRMPHGRREPEVLETGAGILPGLVFLPDASHRLRSRDDVRVGLFSRRFAPARPVTLDSGAMLVFEQQQLEVAEGVRQLGRNGQLARVRA